MGGVKQHWRRIRMVLALGHEIRYPDKAEGVHDGLKRLQDVCKRYKQDIEHVL